MTTAPARLTPCRRYHGKAPVADVAYMPITDIKPGAREGLLTSVSAGNFMPAATFALFVEAAMADDKTYVRNYTHESMRELIAQMQEQLLAAGQSDSPDVAKIIGVELNQTLGLIRDLELEMQEIRKRLGYEVI